MLRHRIVVRSRLDALVATFARTGFVTADTHELLKVVRIRDGIGTLREVAGDCVIDLFDDGDGAEVARLVEWLRGDGLVVHHEIVE